MKNENSGSNKLAVLVEARLGNGMKENSPCVRPEDEYFPSGGVETRASVAFQPT